MVTEVNWPGPLLEKLRRLRRRGKTQAHCALVLGVSKRSVRYACETYRVRRPKLAVRVQRALPRLKALGLTDHQIAVKLGCSQEVVSRNRRLLGLPSNGHSGEMRRRQEERRRVARTVYGVETCRQMNVIKVMFRLGDDLTVKDIHLSTGLNRQYISAVLAELRAAGAVVADWRDRKTRSFSIEPAFLGRLEANLNVHDMPPPREPCPHLPGSPGKIEALRRRVKSRTGLWHPHDGLSYTVNVYSGADSGNYADAVAS